MSTSPTRASRSSAARISASKTPPTSIACPPYEIVRDIVTLAHEHPEADGVFCCGGCFRTVGVVAEIERECGIPVVGTQQANMWNCLRMCGVNDRLEGFGTLLERPRL